MTSRTQSLCRIALWLWLAWPAGILIAQTYAPPTAGDYGGAGPFAVAVETFVNPVYPTANGQTLTVSVYHPVGTLDSALPTIFFAHGFTNPVGSAAEYSALLNQLASPGYNVVFSPYEGGIGLNPHHPTPTGDSWAGGRKSKFFAVVCSCSNPHHPTPTGDSWAGGRKSKFFAVVEPPPSHADR